jgi:FkbM family methyltransferase
MPKIATHSQTAAVKLDYGAYAPHAKVTHILSFLTRIGLGRGAFAKQLCKLWRKWHGDQVDITVRGICYRLDLSNNITDKKILCSSRVYDALELQALSKACGKNGVFVDLGANVGYYSLAMTQAGASRVIAIEPNPKALNRLRFNINANAAEAKVTVLPYGAGDGNPCDLFFCGDLGSASVIKSENSAASTIRIQTKTLKDLLKEANTDRIDGMKVDIEGNECAVLSHFFGEAPQSLWPSVLVLEHCHSDSWSENLSTLLSAKGYDQTGKTRSNLIFTFAGH